jgi:hypothetical protein
MELDQEDHEQAAISGFNSIISHKGVAIIGTVNYQKALTDYQLHGNYA